MSNSAAVDIAERFFIAFEALKQTGKIRIYQDFFDAYGIDRGMFYKVKRDHESNLFRVAWLAHLVNDFGVNPEWLMTGKGKMFR